MQERVQNTAGLFNLSAGKGKAIPLPLLLYLNKIEIMRILDDILAKERQDKEAAEGVLEQINRIKKAILAAPSAGAVHQRPQRGECDGDNSHKN